VNDYINLEPPVLTTCENSFTNASRYAYHANCFAEREALMESMFEVVQSLHENLELISGIMRKAQFYVIPFGSMDQSRLIKYVVYDMAEKHSILFPSFALSGEEAPDDESGNNEDGSSSLPRDAEETKVESNDAANDALMLSLVSDMVGKIAEMQGEIHRLGNELAVLRQSVPISHTEEEEEGG
jgi:hypothetical protein